MIFLKPGFDIETKGYEYEKTDILAESIRITGPMVEEEMEKVYERYPDAVVLLENLDDPDQKLFLQ